LAGGGAGSSASFASSSAGGSAGASATGASGSGSGSAAVSQAAKTNINDSAKIITNKYFNPFFITFSSLELVSTKSFDSTLVDVLWQLKYQLDYTKDAIQKGWFSYEVHRIFYVILLE
jgi:hypothetical protein